MCQALSIELQHPARSGLRCCCCFVVWLDWLPHFTASPKRLRVILENIVIVACVVVVVAVVHIAVVAVVLLVIIVIIDVTTYYYCFVVALVSANWQCRHYTRCYLLLLLFLLLSFLLRLLASSVICCHRCHLPCEKRKQKTENSHENMTNSHNANGQPSRHTACKPLTHTYTLIYTHYACLKAG